MSDLALASSGPAPAGLRCQTLPELWLLAPWRCLTRLESGALGSGLVSLGLFLLPGRIVGLRLGMCLRIGGCLAFVVQALLVDLFDRDSASIFRGLHGFAGNPDHRFAVGVLVGGIGIDLIHQTDGMLIGVAGIGLGSLDCAMRRALRASKNSNGNLVFRTTGSNL